MWYVLEITNEITNMQNCGFWFKLLAGAASRIGLGGYVLGISNEITNKITNMQTLVLVIKYEATSRIELQGVRQKKHSNRNKKHFVKYNMLYSSSSNRMIVKVLK